VGHFQEKTGYTAIDSPILTTLLNRTQVCRFGCPSDRAERFYQEVLDLAPLFRNERLCGLDAGGQTILLLFKRGASLDMSTPHDGSGPLHAAFAFSLLELGHWEERLASHAIPVEERATWPRGGVSLYFRDPDGHLLELATPGTWDSY
jgi:catechol-2,3-dioxygenase